MIGESLWTKQSAVLHAVTQSKRVAVPSAFGTGKTHLAARAALWRSLVFPPGTSLTVTTATRFRQVVRQLWPHIRTAVAKANLPLHADQTQLKAYDSNGTEVVVAYGFSAPPHDEAAVQGIHAPRLFIVVDEAGGISRIIGGAMRGLLTGEDTRLLAIGNPPTDDEGSWFELLCESDEERKHGKVITVLISAYDAPLQTGEKTRRRRTCPVRDKSSSTTSCPSCQTSVGCPDCRCRQGESGAKTGRSSSSRHGRSTGWRASSGSSVRFVECACEETGSIRIIVGIGRASCSRCWRK